MVFIPVEHSLSRVRDGEPARWRPAVDGVHRLLNTAVLGGAAVVSLAQPEAGSAMVPWSAAALLVGGALIGVPHGSSDFVVAHRALRPRFGRVWLPLFLVAYLTLVAVVMAGWAVAPLATLLAFILVSGLHFGRGDLRPDERRSGLALAVRATTPLLPVLLVHPSGVTPLIGILAGVQEISVAKALADLHWLVVPWALAVGCYVLAPILARLRAQTRPGSVADAGEVGVVAVTAVTLPPLLGFALYFCLVHAVRHMIDIADDHEPRESRRAAFLAATIVLPSACICLVALGLAWNSLAGTLGTVDVLAWSLRLIAALTVPHMALEAWAERSKRQHCPC